MIRWSTTLRREEENDTLDERVGQRWMDDESNKCACEEEENIHAKKKGGGGNVQNSSYFGVSCRSA
jgi:hypothetical protein